MLYYQESNKWSKIAAHLGDPRPNKCLSNEFYDYIKSNKKVFSEEEVGVFGVHCCVCVCIVFDGNSSIYWNDLGWLYWVYLLVLSRIHCWTHVHLFAWRTNLSFQIIECNSERPRHEWYQLVRDRLQNEEIWAPSALSVVLFAAEGKTSRAREGKKRRGENVHTIFSFFNFECVLWF